MMVPRAMSRESDLVILEVLDLHYHRGLSAAKIAVRLGLTKGACIGYITRFKADATPCACKKKRNRDGGMRRRWWA